MEKNLRHVTSKQPFRSVVGENLFQKLPVPMTDDLDRFAFDEVFDPSRQSLVAAICDSACGLRMVSEYGLR
jgi:hypothetical protein